jgi:hypothetical protein
MKAVRTALRGERYVANLRELSIIVERRDLQLGNAFRRRIGIGSRGAQENDRRRDLVYRIADHVCVAPPRPVPRLVRWT